jgi:hypothetical protein
MDALAVLQTFAALAGLAVPSVGPLYDVQVGPGAEFLAVEARLPAGSSAPLVLADGGERFVRRPEVETPRGWQALAPTGGGFSASCLGGCHVRYRFLLHEAARAFGDPRVAAQFADAYVAPPSTWLLHPSEQPSPGYRLEVRAPAGVQALCGLPRAAGTDGFEVSRAGLRIAPMCAFGAWRFQSIAVGTSRISLAIAPGRFAMSDKEVRRWVAEAAEAIASYYQGFPVPQLLLMVTPKGGRTLNGVTLGEGGASILLKVGTEMPAKGARNHWLLTHELMHLGFPSMAWRHAWIEEGMAVFGEPVVRTRAGMIGADAFWEEWLEQGPVGLPGAGDGGLERTHTWARTYWGGGLFWLLADVTLRQRSGGTRSVDDVLRALVHSGGNVESRWEMDEVLRVTDAAAGTPVFSELFRSMAEAPGAPDLDALWKRLGISLERGRVVYDDGAPLASVRRALAGR